jgi:FAD/FMN-containing dehydrogenase
MPSCSFPDSPPADNHRNRLDEGDRTVSIDGIDVVRPGDSTYEEVKDGWNLLHQHKPAEVRFPKTVEEAAACLTDVVDGKTAFRIRSGGHDINGYSSADDAVVIDLRHLDSIVISDDSTHVAVGPAVRFNKLYPALASRKLVVPAGAGEDVAVGGHALGGGNGYLQRFLGASCDQIINLKMIDSRGLIIQANAKENSDLFWALRGAGNMNFGLVFEYTYRTTRVEKLSTFAITLDWDDDEVFDLWQRWAPFADTRLTSTFTLHEESMAVLGMFAGPQAELTSLLPDFLLHPRRGEALSVEEYDGYDRALTGLMSYYLQGGSSEDYEHATFASAAVMCNLLDRNAQADFKDVVRHSPGISSIVVFARGGRICGVPSDFNAYRYRTQHLEPMIRTTWRDDVDREACLAWVSDSYQRLKPNFQGIYKNWASAHVEPSMYQWYGDDIPRLVSTKRRIDPDNVFSNPQSIPL